MTRKRLTALVAVLAVLLALGICRQAGVLPGGVQPVADGILFVAIAGALVYGDAIATLTVGRTNQ
jgi:hypothetical protein